MATRLDSGNIQLRQVNAAPMQQIVPRGVDYVGPRAEAQANQTLANIIDRMGQFANTLIGEIRQEQAVQYTIDNPPTQEQLEKAINGDPSEIVPAGNFTYFDRAVRKARAFQLSQAFEQEGRAKLVDIATQVSENKITADVAKQQIEVMIKGFTGAVAKASPEAALKFNASMTADGHMVYKQALDVQLKREKEKAAVTLAEDFEKKLALYVGHVSSNPLTAPAIEIRDREDLLRAAAALGPEVLKEYQGKIDKAFLEANVNSVLQHIISDKDLMADYIGTREKIITGQLGKMSPIMENLIKKEPGSVMKILTTFTQQSVDVVQENQRKAQADAKQKEQQFVDLYAQWLTAKTPEDKRRLQAQMVPLARSTAELDKILKPEQRENKGDPLLVSRLRDDIANKVITSPYQLHPYFKRGQINADQLSSLQTAIGSGDTKDDVAARKTLRMYAGVGDTLNGVFDKEAAQFKKLEKLDERYDNAVRVERERQRALPPEKRTGIDFQAIADRVMADYKNTDVQADVKQEARKKLETIKQRVAKDFKRDIEINEKTSIEDLRKLKGKKEGDYFESNIFSKDDLERIEKQIKILGQ